MLLRVAFPRGRVRSSAWRRRRGPDSGAGPHRRRGGGAASLRAGARRRSRSGFSRLGDGLAIAELNRRALAPVGRFVREALAARVTAEAMQRGELTYLSPVAAFPGFPRALTDTFEELRLNAVTPEHLRECGRSGPDLSRLLAAYTDELTARRLADHAARVSLAREAALAEMAVVTLDEAAHPTGARTVRPRPVLSHPPSGIAPRFGRR